jgi:hypothetical protein
MLRWLREYLNYTTEEKITDFCAWAMYRNPLDKIEVTGQGYVRGFVAALKLMAGKRHLVALLR